MLIYDGECGICSQSADWARAHLPAGTDIVTWQSIPDLSALGLTVHDVETAAYWVDDDGTLHRGEAAVTHALRRADARGWRVAGTVLGSRPVRPLAQAVYYWVARNRYRFSKNGACATR